MDRLPKASSFSILPLRTTLKRMSLRKALQHKDNLVSILDKSFSVNWQKKVKSDLNDR